MPLFTRARPSASGRCATTTRRSSCGGSRSDSPTARLWREWKGLPPRIVWSPRGVSLSIEWRKADNSRNGVRAGNARRSHRLDQIGLLLICVVACRSGWGVGRLNSTLRLLPQGRCLRACAPACLVALLSLALAGPAPAETLPQALVRTYQNNPQLNAERARQRGTDEGVSQALAGYRPQLLATLTGGLQQVRVLFFDNTIQTATLRTWTVGLTVSQTLFNGFKTANTVRQSEAQVLSGREALRNTGQGVLLDAVTVYTNLIANQSLVEAQRINVTFLRETLATTKTRLEGGDVTPTDVAQAEARLSRGLADLNAAEVGLAISQALYAQVIGVPPGRLAPAE